MAYQSILYTILSSIPMFVCAFWTLIFGIKFRKLDKSKKILCIFMVVATSLYLGHFIIFNHLYRWVPITDTIYTYATLSVYPIFYLYITSLTESVKSHKLWILLPGAIIGSIVGICYVLLPTDQLNQFIYDCHYEEKQTSIHAIAYISMIVHRLMKPIIALQVASVLFCGFKKLHRFKTKVENFFSNTEHKDMSEVKHLLVFFVVTSCLSVVADLIGRAYFIDSTLLMTLIMTPFSIMLFCIGHVGYNQNFTIADLQKEMAGVYMHYENKDITNSADINAELRTSLMQEIDQLMEKEQLYLQENLKLSDIAQRLNTNRTYIYEALKMKENAGINSFNEYVNTYRINHAVSLLKESPNENIDQFVYRCGFASKSTFYSNFKKITGLTPKQYIKKIEVNTSSNP